jgi:hypothetical protein
MEINRYIFKLKNIDTKELSEDKLFKSLSSYSIRIIDDSMFPKMILVESKVNLIDIVPQDIKEIWNIYLEKSYKVPDTRKFPKP